MKGLLVAAGIAAVSLFAVSSAEAACRQVYGGTSCNWLGQCWHNPPKTVCDAPPPKIAAPPPQNRVSVQPSLTAGRLIGQDGGTLISPGNKTGSSLISPGNKAGSSLISNNQNGLISPGNKTGSSLISNNQNGLISPGNKTGSSLISPGNRTGSSFR
jgi:hypothetical protein